MIKQILAKHVCFYFVLLSSDVLVIQGGVRGTVGSRMFADLLARPSDTQPLARHKVEQR